MTFIQILNSIGAIATIGMGCLGFFTPHMASKMTGLTATNKTAFAEFMATFGGVFIAMGLIPLLTNEPLANFMAGTIWISAALGRLVSVIVDRGYQEKKNIGGIAFEASFGILMLAGSPFLTRL